MSSDEEDQCNNIQCLNCKKVIDGKPWIIVQLDDKHVYGCSYLCSRNFKVLIGTGYWNNVMNKEDFNEPRPVYGYTSRSNNKDITTGFGIDEIKEEIDNEEKRIEMIEQEYEYDYSSDDSFCEDIY